MTYLSSTETTDEITALIIMILPRLVFVFFLLLFLSFVARISSKNTAQTKRKCPGITKTMNYLAFGLIALNTMGNIIGSVA